MTLDMYQENILDHYAHPHNKGRLDPADMRAKERNPLCGDEIEVFVVLDGERRIADVKFEGQGCAISQAGISMLTDELKGKTLDELERMTAEDIKELVGVPLSPVRLKCAVLSLQTAHSALADYKLRQLGVAQEHPAAEAHVHGSHCAH
jgi:nitrogen fixation protein NifU and related proteins